MASPAKYTPRFQWVHTSGEDPTVANAWRSANSDVYWDHLWTAADKTYCVLHVPGKGYFVSPNMPETPHEQDRGPYPTRNVAVIAAETLCALEAGE